jgi:hypothetical protein
MNFLRSALLISFALITTAASAAGPKPTTPLPNKVPRSQYAIYYDVRQGWRSLVTLNNATRDPTAVQITAFAPNGEGVVLGSVRVAPRETQSD